MSSLCAVQCGYVGFRFLRYKCSPWLMLAMTFGRSLTIAPLQLFLSSGVQRTHAANLGVSAIGKINFVGAYGLLHDLLR
jgi:hypothetical protein